MRLVILFLGLMLSGSLVWADGTKQASPTNSANGAALFVDPAAGNGNYFNCPTYQRLQFSINSHTTENLYFGLHPRTFSNGATTLVTNAFYRIRNAAGTVVSGPTAIPTTGTGFISTWAQANAGPNIGGATPAGYAPLTFDPTANGDYFIELYQSNDAGATSVNAQMTIPLFDFTVSTAANVQSPGRLWNRKWSFATCDISDPTFPCPLSSSFTGDYYAYTPDHFILQVKFEPGFRPLGYQIAMNFTGPGTSGTFTTDRISVNSNVTVPPLNNGYQVFLTTPDNNLFPNGTPGNPAITSNIFGCPGQYYIPYVLDQPGDVSILIDLNGTTGYQSGTADVVLEAYGLSAGNQVMAWNGLNGLGAAVPVNFSAAVTVTLYQGRTNIPMNDAELNTNGFSVVSIFPSLGNRRLYWDDASITPFGTCGAATDNTTTGGITNTSLVVGQLGPSHAWDGNNPSLTTPAASGTIGSSTITTFCDDYGNARCLNTWFYAADFASPITNMLLPGCDLDNDGISNNVDLDDDNDGIPDLTECSSDPLLDADSDGIPNYLDPDFAGFVDSNNDGVNDNFDFDRDGIINSFDLDSDGDGITDLKENGQPDANNNGQIDGFADLNANGLADSVDPNCTAPTSGQASANAGTTGTITGAANATDASVTTFAALTSNPAALDLDFGTLLPAGTIITVNLSSAVAGASGGTLQRSADDVTYSQSQAYSVTGTTSTGITYMLGAAARYLRVTVTTNNDTRLYIATYSVCGGVVGTPITLVNTDGTGGANYLDIDSDGDGIVDNIEAQSTAGYIAPSGSDTDRDGIDNAYDATSGFGGAGTTPVNTDGTDNPDYTDLNSDNDLYTDAIEGWDTDGNGVANTTPAGTDADGDGLDDAYDVNDSAINPANGTTPASYPNVNNSSTAERDWRETFIPPTVTLTGTASIAENAPGVVTLTATLSFATTVATTVTLTYTGTATNGTDYVASSTTITIPAGSTTGTVTIDPTDDLIYEGNETAIATISGVTGGNGATAGTPNAATVTITDDETVPTVSISGTASIAENAGTAVTLTATLSGPASTATVVTLTYTGTATNATDYNASSTTITIPAGSTTGTVTITPVDDAIYEGNETVIATISGVTGGNGVTTGTPNSATVTITDNETVPNVTLTGTTSIAENAGTSVTLTATLSGAASTATTITLTYTGTATSGTDYNASSTTITIPAGSTTGTVTITPIDDAIYEGNETVIGTISSVTGGNGATTGSPSVATVTIVDNETSRTVSISGTTTVAENSGTAVTLTATLSGAASTATVVTLTYTGTATSGTDYTASSTTITIPAGSTTGTVTVTPIDDVIYEGNETVIATITGVTGGNGATTGTPSAATVTITDNETVPTVSISGTASVAENSGTAVTLTAALSVAASTATTVTLTYTGTATNGTDYTPSSTTITIPAGSLTGTVTITPIDDAIYEGNETVIATITGVTGGNGATIGTPGAATVTITDNETVPTVSISGTTSIAENAGTAVTLTATLSGPASATTTVTLTYTGTATSGTDYTASSTTITIPAGSTTGTVTITPIDDAIYEGNETTIATITAVTGGNGVTIGTPNSATVTILDNETPRTVSITGTTTVAENSGTAVTLTATLSGAASTATTVTLTYTGTATSGADYTASSTTITIPAGSTTGTVTITPIDDAIFEGSETVIATITGVAGGTGATTGTPNNATVTIIDNETTPIVSLTGTTSIAENAGTSVLLTATLSSATTVATTVTIAYTGTATSGTDYTTPSTTITIPAGSTTGTVTITPIDDVIFEGNETVIGTIAGVSGGSGATIGTPNSATVTIVDNETGVSVSLTGTTTITENAGTAVTLTATLSATTSQATVVTIAYTGTATNGTDYSALSTTITIPAGVLTGTVTVTPIDDAIYEGNETVIATISNVTGGNGALASSPTSATVTITDNEVVPTVSISGTTSIAENAGTLVTLTATLSGPASTATTVTLTYTGTATSGTDYTASSTTISIPAGSTTGTVTITPVDDVIYEGNETVIATITGVTGGNGATIGTPGSATVTIVDNEVVPAVSITGTTTVAENSGTAVTLTATLSVAASTATTVTLTYTGTATSGTDYTASSTTIIIPAGSTSGTVTVTPIDDAIYEGNETVIATITSVTGGNGSTIGAPNTATVTIVDNEVVPSVNISGTTAVAENGGSSVTLTATLSGPASVATTVTLTYTGTATIATDYTVSSVTITIPAGSTTGTVTVTPIDDAIYEGNETVIATITGVTGGNGATIGTTTTATVTIVDNETIPTVTLTGTATVAENSGTAVTLTATLSGPASTATTVTLTYSGTATSGTDYTASSTTITIPAGSTTGTITVTPIDDVIYEGNETVVATISSVTGGNGATTGSPSAATVTITDNETVPTVTLTGTASILENAGTAVTLTATLSVAASTATTITLTYTGTATNGTDYTSSSTTITIPAGSTTGTVTITPTDDVTYEGDETVIVTITSVTGGNGTTIGTPNTATVTIVDNETAPTVTLTGTTTVAENSGTTVSLTATLSGPASTATTVTLTYSGTATSGTDYTSSSATITIPAGSTTGTVTITPTDDLIYEGDETVVATITGVTGGNGATIGSPGVATVTITDNETVPTVTLTGTTSIAENAGTSVTLTATLSGPASTATTVTLTYTGTATDGTDYTSSSVTITIPAGSTTGTVTITPIDDAVYEGNETVVVDITNVAGGNGATESGTQTATVTIIEDDNAIPVAVANSASATEDNTVVIPAIQTNDSDADGSVVVSTIDLDPATPGQQTTVTTPEGTWTVNTTTGDVTFTPAADFNGTATINYTINDNVGATSNQATLTVVVSPVNDSPIVDNDVNTIAEDGGSASGDLTDAGDFDPDGTTLTVNTTPVSGPSNGTIVINTDGTYSYTPNPNFNGTDVITVQICDAGTPIPAICVTQTLTITVTAVNDAPIVDNDTNTIPEDGGPTTGDLTDAGDSDPDGTTLTANTTPVYGPNNGNVTINTNGTYSYTPNANFFGSDTIVVAICDAGLPLPSVCVNDTLIILVTPVNDAPVAVANSTTTNEDTPVVLSAIQSNDTDVDGTVVVGTIDLDPATPGQQTTFTNAQGTWTVNPTTGDVTFTPAANFNGTAAINYTINDNGGAVSNAATLTVNVAPVNDTPIVDNEFISVPENGSATGDLTNAGDSDTDGTTLTANTTPVVNPSNGILVVNANGTFVYTPNPGYTGTDMAVVSICDAGLPLPAICVNDTIFLNVLPTIPPVANNDNATTLEDTPITINVTTNDTDIDGTVNAATVDLDPSTAGIQTTFTNAQGIWTADAAGNITFTPAPNFNGTASIDYTVNDNIGATSNTGTVTITVTPVNDAPIVDNDTNTIPEDGGSATGDLTDAGDSDTEGTVLVVNPTPVSGPAHGTIVINTDGTYSYTPNPNFNGTDVIVVQVCDSGLPLPAVCTTDTLTITVTPVNDPPASGNETINTEANTQVPNINVTANNTDVDGDPLTVTAPATSSNGGTVTVNPDGTITYTPPTDYIGMDTIVYTVCDTAAVPNCVQDTLFVNVQPQLDSDGDGIPNIDDLDDDNDGIPDTVESATASNGGDSDGDGVPDSLDLDSDNDGIPDVIEAGGTDPDGDGMIGTGPIADTDGDGLSDIVDPNNGGTPLPIADFDGDGNPDYQDLDSDNDGIPDVVEAGGTDTNGDGMIDTFNDANGDGMDDNDIHANPEDTDGDGLPDYTDLDSDNDGIPDVVEGGGTDANGDGVIDNFNDANGDGLDDNDSHSNPADTDGDGHPDYVDLDSDNDGIPDVVEGGGTDTNGDGVIDNFNDANGDGLDDNDSHSNPADTDGDGHPDYVDLDSDNDGIPDVVEGGGTDANGDGVIDNFNDANGDGLDDNDSHSNPADTDGDGHPDYVDLDSDNDGIPDVVEGGGTDANGDGVIDNFNDTNGDGLDDNDSHSTPPDTNGDGTPDYVDLDSDGDGIPDVVEGGGTDTNGDGVIDNFNDANGDGMDDNDTNSTPTDTDGDGNPDYTDTDSDNDSVPDNTENDPNGDGTGPDDTDGDGIPDYQDGDDDGDGIPTVDESGNNGGVYNDCDNDGIPDYLDSDKCTVVSGGIVIPEAFSPNGDGTNETFEIQGLENYPGNTLLIFNRWGYEVYSATDYDNKWTGTSNGKMNVGGDLLPTGTYYYLLDTKTEELGVIKGYVYIKR